MSPSNKKVEVKGPAVQEMQKNKSCLRRSCSKGCFFIIFLFIAFLVIIKFTGSPNIKTTEKVPKNFPEDIEVYDKEKINKITVSSENNSLLAKSAKIVPKFLIVSTHVVLGENSPQELEGYLRVSSDIESKNLFNQFVYLMKNPTKKHKNRIEIKWSNLSAEPSFITNFYQSSLENKDYSSKIISDKKEEKRINFTKRDIVGNIYIKDNPKQTGTDHMSLSIIIPPNK